jgi:hypothetical protein
MVPSKGFGVVLGFSFLFGLIRSLGLYGTWREFRGEVSPQTLFNTNVVDFALAIGTAGEWATILVMGEY